jgi:hypothetical protein
MRRKLTAKPRRFKGVCINLLAPYFGFLAGFSSNTISTISAEIAFFRNTTPEKGFPPDRSFRS